MSLLSVESLNLAAVAAAVDARVDQAAFDREWVRLHAVLQGPVPVELRLWGSELAERGDATPLLGTHHCGPRYEALLWNGARCPTASVMVTGLLHAGGTAPAGVAAAVAAGLRVNRALAEQAPPGPAVATLPLVGCAVTAALLLAPTIPIARVVDLAGSLMVVGSASALASRGRTDLIRIGHPVAAAWLAVRCLAAGLTAPAGTLEKTLATVGGGVAGPVPGCAPWLAALPLSPQGAG